MITLFEQELLDNPNKLSWMHSLLSKHQFSEDFLIETIGTLSRSSPSERVYSSL